MNKAVLISALTLLLTVHCIAQNSGAALYLTSYTFSTQTKAIGYIRIKGDAQALLKSVAIQGDYKDAFKIGKDHQLLIKPEKLKSDQIFFEVVLTASTSQGPLTDTFHIVRDEFIHNKVIAHRGAWKNTGASQNSIAALKQSIALGCEGSEFDVHMSADSVLVINHDASIQGISIAKTKSDSLKDIKLSNGELMPTLENFLKAGVQQNKTKLILEIKASELGKPSSIALSRRVVALVERLHVQGWVDYISFDYDVCKEVLRLAPYAKVSYLKGDKTPAELSGDSFYGLDYHFSVLQKNPDWITEAKQKKLTLNVWTVNDTTTMNEMLQHKVDFITTDEPELLLSLLSKK
jgi:glycerophosphoryl diester phosphodiesterase